MIDFLIQLMGGKERGPIIIDCWEITALPFVVWFGIMIYRRMRKGSA